MSDQLPREVDVFNAALQLPPNERAGYLNDACGDDSELRSRVGELLEAHESAGTFLEDLTDASSVTATNPSSRAKVSARMTSEFGDYELLEEIGRGGQGVVYRARQKSLNRTVALKIIGLGHWASATHLKRFRRDAEAAASLEHPQIVPIYEIGERDGSCYFSMKFVEGGQLDEAIKSATADSSGGEREPMSLRNAAELLVKIARTVQFAHKHGILHRDIKPGNILLDRNGEPHLTDFGLARLIEQESTVTNSFDILGTPSYMSPEQAAGHTKELTSATDVYSLGAVFYQMLTGEPPFAGGTTYETIRMVLESEPRNPRARNPKVDLDLATICLKCLEKDPARRYPTALALAEDVERWLRREPIQARRTGLLMRGRKWLQRNPATAVSTASLAVLAITFGLIIWKTELLRSSATTGIAVLPFENLSENKEDEFFADGVQDDILTKLAKISGLKVISRTSVMAYRGARDIKEIGRALNVSHVLEGSVRRDVGRIHLNTNLIEARTDRHVWAEEYDRYLNDVFAVQSEIAKKVAEQLHAKISPDEKQSIDRAPTTDLAAFDLYTRAKTILLSNVFSAAGEQNLRRAVELLNQAVERDPAFFDAYYQLAYAHEELYLLGFDHTDERARLAEAALQTLTRLRPNAAEMHLARAQYLYRIHRDYEGALVELENARRSLPNDPRLFELTGRILRRRGQPEENLRNLEHALELDPRNHNTMQQVAISYLALRRFSKAATMLDRALTIVPNDVVVKGARAWVDLDWKANARPLHEMIEAILAKDPASISDAADNWFCCALLEHDYPGAERALVALGDNPWWVDDTVVLSRSFGEGLLARLTKDEGKALAAFNKARAEQEKIVKAQPDNGPPLCVLGLIDAALGHKEAALQEGRRAVELLPAKKDFIDGNHMIQYFAITAAWAGEKDVALQQLEISVRTPAPKPVISYGELKLLPLWDPLRGDPRFEKIVSSLAPK